MYERLNWLGRDGIESDHFGAQLISKGLTTETLLNWRMDPVVTFEGSPQSLFDIHENLDVDGCIRKASAVYSAEQKLIALRRRQMQNSDDEEEEEEDEEE
jgi:hypothetical protein